MQYGRAKYRLVKRASDIPHIDLQRADFRLAQSYDASFGPRRLDEGRSVRALARVPRPRVSGDASDAQGVAFDADLDDAATARGSQTWPSSCSVSMRRGPIVSQSEQRPLKLEQLPVIARAFKRLRVAQTIDELVKPDPRRTVSVGRCVEALVTSILTGTHTLYRVDQKLEGYDLSTGFAWTETGGLFHDERLARALDALSRTGLNKVESALFVRAVEEYKLDLSTFRLDTTNSQVFGEYATSREPKDPEDPDAIPHLTKGHSKDSRRTLKQVVFGLAVTGEGIPLIGRAASGNRADVLELRQLMRRVAER